MRSWLFFAGVLAVACSQTAGCSISRSHLEKTEQAASSSKAGAGGAGGATHAVGSGGHGGAQTVTSTSTQSSSASGPIEPTGTTKLTLVNGIVDQDAVRFCLSKYPAGPGAELPWPSAAGLPFARGGVIDIPSVVPSGSDVEIRAVLGSGAAVNGKSCSELAALPAGVSVLSLGVAPASLFSEPKSLLLVAYGCTGGPTHTNGLQTLACGQGYTPTSPTAALLAGFMSRLGANTVRMQFVDAIAALANNNQVVAGVAPGYDAAPVQTAVQMFTVGTIGPFPPFDLLTASKLSDLTKATVEVDLFGNPYKVGWSDAFKNGGLPLAAKDGEGLVFIAVGSQPGIGDGPWWHKMTFTVVKADP